MKGIMNYSKIYFQIIDRAKTRILADNVYTEKHHILPRCMSGGNNESNIVVLTAREHFIVHWLLVKMHPDVWKLYFAFFQMTKKHTHDRIISSRQFEIARKTLSEGAKMRYILGLHPRKTDAGRLVLSQKMIGDSNPMRLYPERNHTARPHVVLFEDGSTKRYQYGKLGYEDIGMSRSSWIVAVTKGTPVRKFKVVKITKEG